MSRFKKEKEDENKKELKYRKLMIMFYSLEEG